jgi:uncharacterized protein YecE (DUF72 family)
VARKVKARAASSNPKDADAPVIPDLMIGCSGWFYWHWRDTFYPTGCPTHHWFSHYARNFKTVELNAPFYRWPKPSTVKCWVRQAPRGFIYSVKANQIITHEKRLIGTKRLVKQFSAIADVLGPMMGCFLFQFPPSFRYTPGRLKKLIEQLDHSRRNVVEFRHKSWWNRDVFKALRKTGTIFCSTSGPRLPDQLVKTADEIYIRFHGTKKWYRHDYSKEELTVWADRIRESGASRAWIYFNNDRDAYSIKNARMLLRLLGRRPPVRTQAYPADRLTSKVKSQLGRV